MTDIPDYNTVRKALMGADALTSVSESHGLLVGLLCSGKIANIDAGKWAESSMLQTKDKDPTATDTLITLFEVTKQKLEDMDFSFEILLPEDDSDESLDLRARELGAWCGGVVSGLKLGNVDLEGNYTEDCQDALDRIVEIAEINYDEVSFEEDDEPAYVEIVEYLRLAILIVYTDIAKGKPSGNGVPNVQACLH